MPRQIDRSIQAHQHGNDSDEAYYAAQLRTHGAEGFPVYCHVGEQTAEGAKDYGGRAHADAVGFVE